MEGMESPLYVSGTQSVHTDDGSQCGSTAATSVASHWEQDNLVTFLVGSTVMYERRNQLMAHQVTERPNEAHCFYVTSHFFSASAECERDRSCTL